MSAFGVEIGKGRHWEKFKESADLKDPIRSRRRDRGKMRVQVNNFTNFGTKTTPFKPGKPTKKADEMSKSAFGVALESEDVAKAFDKTRARNASDKKLRSQLSRSEGLGAATGGGIYTAAKAPKGKRGEAFREHGRYMSGGKSKGGLVGTKKPGLTHRGAYVHTRQKMEFGKSAFGVDLTTADVIAKADDKPSTGRYAAGTAFGAYHSLAAGKKGKKLKAAGSSLGHSAAGYLGGAAAGAALGRGRLLPTALGASTGALAGSARAVHSNQEHGRYKPQS